MKLKIPTTIKVVIDNLKAGEEIRREREVANISLRTLAKRMGFSAAYLSDMERGRRNWSNARFEKAANLIEKLSKKATAQ